MSRAGSRIRGGTRTCAPIVVLVLTSATAPEAGLRVDGLARADQAVGPAQGPGPRGVARDAAAAVRPDGRLLLPVGTGDSARPDPVGFRASAGAPSRRSEGVRASAAETGSAGARERGQATGAAADRRALDTCDATGAVMGARTATYEVMDTEYYVNEGRCRPGYEPLDCEAAFATLFEYTLAARPVRMARGNLTSDIDDATDLPSGCSVGCVQDPFGSVTVPVGTPYLNSTGVVYFFDANHTPAPAPPWRSSKGISGELRLICGRSLANGGRLPYQILDADQSFAGCPPGYEIKSKAECKKAHDDLVTGGSSVVISETTTVQYYPSQCSVDDTIKGHPDSLWWNPLPPSGSAVPDGVIAKKIRNICVNLNALPTPPPTPSPTPSPTTPSPTAQPTWEPTAFPTEDPTPVPTDPTAEPTPYPTVYGRFYGKLADSPCKNPRGCPSEFIPQWSPPMGWYVGSGEVYITKVGTGQQWPMSHKRLSRIPGPPTPEPTHDNIDALTSNLGTKVPTPHPTAPPIEAHLEKRKKDDKEKASDIQRRIRSIAGRMKSERR